MSANTLQKWLVRSTRWSALSRAGKAPLVRSFSVVPAVSGLFTILFTHGMLTIDELSWRVLAWFLGANFIGLFVIFFRVYCPEIILYFESMFDYAKLYPMFLRERYNKLKAILYAESCAVESPMRLDHWYQDEGFRALVESDDWTASNEVSDEDKCRMLFYNHIFHNYTMPGIRHALFFIYYIGVILVCIPLILNVGAVLLQIVERLLDGF